MMGLQTKGDLIASRDQWRSYAHELEHRLAEQGEWLDDSQAANRALQRQVAELEDDLQMANEAFDEVTGDYAKELVADEPWRTETP